MALQEFITKYIPLSISIAVFDNLSNIGNVDILDKYEAQRFIIRDIELNSVRYEADIVVSGQIY